MKSDTLKIGHTIKSFGKEGYLKVNIEKSYIKDVKNSRYLFIKIDGFLLPYFVEDFDIESSLIKFDEIHNPQECRPLSDSEIFLFTKDVTQPPKIKNSEYNVLVGWKLEDQNGMAIGEIMDIVVLPKQTLLSIERKDKEVLIPFHESLILGLDKSSKTIYMEIAEGLLDI